MQIDDSKRSRDVLKGYFSKNAIPTEGQFAELIGSCLSQRDDRVVKEANGPLSLEGAGDATSLKKCLSFYLNFADADPAWTVALRPRVTASDAGSGQTGYSLNDPSGLSRFYIDSANGNIGVGTILPQAKLQVEGRIQMYGLSVAATTDLRTASTSNLLKFGSTGDFQILSKNAGQWGKPVLGYHCDQADAIGFYSTGGRPLLEAEGSSGNVFITGSVRAGNSDLYFTKTDHNYTGVGNAIGWAAIENGADYGALMILGRNVGGAGRAINRVVKLWDYLQVNGSLDVTGTASLDNLKLAPVADLRAVDRLNLVKFGNTGDYQVLHKAAGRWNKPTLAFHCDQADAIGFYTTGWRSVLEAEGSTGNVAIGAALYVGGSDIYFTKTDHNHSGIGNTQGFAAIENATNYGALMILGRATGGNPNRIVKLWDYLQVNGNLDVTGNIVSIAPYIEARGAGGERVYMGGDGAGNDAQFGSLNASVANLVAWNTVNGTMNVLAKAFVQSSDVSLKTNIEPLQGALERVCALRAVHFSWKSGSDSEKTAAREIGFVGQEVEKVLPELVTESRGHLHVNYAGMAPLLVEAIKELRDRVERLEKADPGRPAAARKTKS
jgi:hypothetical protein